MADIVPVTAQLLTDAYSILTIDERRTLSIFHLYQSELHENKGDPNEAKWHLERARIIVATIRAE